MKSSGWKSSGPTPVIILLLTGITACAQVQPSPTALQQFNSRRDEYERLAELIQACEGALSFVPRTPSTSSRCADGNQQRVEQIASRIGQLHLVSTYAHWRRSGNPAGYHLTSITFLAKSEGIMTNAGRAELIVFTPTGSREPPPGEVVSQDENGTWSYRRLGHGG